MPSHNEPPAVLNAAEIVPVMESVIARIQSTLDHIVETVSPSDACFGNVMKPWADVYNEVQTSQGMIWLLMYASPDKETHDQIAKAARLFNKASTKWTSRADLFQLVKAVADKKEELDPESRHYVKEKLRDFIKAGHGSLDEKGIEEYLSLGSKIEELTKKYNKNLIDNRGGAWFSEKDELQGISAAELSTWEKGTGEHEGYRYIPFANGGRRRTILTSATNPATREKVYLGDDSSVPDNVNLFRDVILLRDQRARLLGYENHANFRINSRAIQSVDYVQNFLSELEQSLVPRGKKEIERLQTMRVQDRKELGVWQEGDSEHFPPWDLNYYQAKLKAEVGVNEKDVTPFFPLDTTISGMLRLFETFLGIKFTRVPDSEITPRIIWHKDIQVWKTYRDDEFIGYLYLDLLARERKYKGSQNVNIHCGYDKIDGTRQLPSTVLMCSFPQPTEATCAQLRHTEVVTLFHELGHGMHDLISHTKYSRFHGTRLPVDIGEMPSTLLENWCWTKDILKELSCHYTTLDPDYLVQWRKDNPGQPDPPAKIPDELLDNILKSRNMDRGQYHLHQLTVSEFDVQIHNAASKGVLEQLDMQKLWYDLREKYESMDFSKARQTGHEHVTFGHLLNGYDMGYYGYLACAAFAKDAFYSKFVDDPRSRQQWQEFSNRILKYGGSHPDQLEMLKSFMGREPHFNALADSLNR